jgi:hypothetical protein
MKTPAAKPTATVMIAGSMIERASNPGDRAREAMRRPAAIIGYPSR